MTVLEVIQRSTEFFAKREVDSPRLQIELLLAHVLRLPRLQLYLNFERELSFNELEVLREFVRRRGAREPLQHIVGSVSFCGLELKVRPEALVPRPETEILAERAWQFLGRLAGRQTPVPRALDFGTGNGCLAIALAVHCPHAGIWALDVSCAALSVARENAVRHQVGDRLQLVVADGFTSLRASPCFDLIVANPPYIPTAEIDTLMPEVRDFDPRLALDGGSEGLSFYRRIAAEAPALLRPGGKVMVEFGDGQAEAVRAVFEHHKWIVEAVEPDYTGRLRFLTALANQS